MKRILALLLFLLVISVGCAPTLQELRSYPTTQTIRVKKDTLCVYGKLNKSALSAPLPCFMCDNYIWQSIWDSPMGEIYWMAMGIGHKSLILFTIHHADNNTHIDLKISQSTGAVMTQDFYKQYALTILSSADFSSCPDL